MSKHTPGPWNIEMSKNGELYVKGHSELTVEIMVDGPHDFDEHVRCVEANARLIAESPKLLAAIEFALSEFHDRECNCDGEYVDGRLVGHACYFHRIENELREAIAKIQDGDK